MALDEYKERRESMILFIIITAIAAIASFFDKIRNQTLIFYGAIILVYYIYPFVRFVLIKIYYYMIVKKICDKKEYELKASLKGFIFPDRKNTSPELTIKTGKGVYALRVLGYFRRPAKYVFYGKNSYTVQKAMYLFVRAKPNSGAIPAANLSGNMRSKHMADIDTEMMRENFGDDASIKKILLFCPKFAVCEKFNDLKYEQLYDGSDVFDYTIYNANEFAKWL